MYTYVFNEMVNDVLGHDVLDGLGDDHHVGRHHLFHGLNLIM